MLCFLLQNKIFTYILGNFSNLNLKSFVGIMQARSIVVFESQEGGGLTHSQNFDKQTKKEEGQFKVSQGGGGAGVVYK